MKRVVSYQHIGLEIDKGKITSCTVVNGNCCQSFGTVQLPVLLRNRVFFIETIHTDIELAHVLILGADCWRIVDIVPELRKHEWYLSNEPIFVNSVEHTTNIVAIHGEDETGCCCYSEYRTHGGRLRLYRPNWTCKSSLKVHP